MAQVTISIDGKAYRMACEEGQEAHLDMLASRFDRYVSHLKSQFGEIGDLRLTVMAGIMVMDELNETNKRVNALEAELASLKADGHGAAEAQARTEQVMIGTLSELTGRIEGIAAKLAAKAPVTSQTGA